MILFVSSLGMLVELQKLFVPVINHVLLSQSRYGDLVEDIFFLS